jgi:hypothetical protein
VAGQPARFAYFVNSTVAHVPSGLSYHTNIVRSKINESKSKYLTFTLRNDPSTPIYLNNGEIPSAATVKHLGLHLDNKLNWKDHIVKKRKQMDLRHKELYIHGSVRHKTIL